MRIGLKKALAGGLLLAALALPQAANAGVQKFFLSGNLNTCQQVFNALAAMSPPIFHGAITAEILITAPPGGGTTGSFTGSGRTVSVTMASGQASFNWTETTIPAALGFDVVAVKAGNGRTAYVYNPDQTSDTNVSDLNTTQKITEILFCADDVDENVTLLPTCNLNSAQLQDACDALGNTTVFSTFVPGSSAGTGAVCACPGVQASVCDATPICTGPGCDGATTCDPSGADGKDPESGLVCCTAGSSGTQFILNGIPQVQGTVDAIGSDVSVSGNSFLSFGTGLLFVIP